MAATGLIRTQYWNVTGVNPTPRAGVMSRAEARTDVEGFVLAADAARAAALFGWGVASGLAVSTDAQSSGVRVSTGVAIDREGRLIVLAEGGVAITDPLVGPTGLQNVPTQPVDADGVFVETAQFAAGTMLVTVSWREVEDIAAGTLLVLRQAPWLRVVAPQDVVDDGVQLVLAQIEVAPGGVVSALAVAGRRIVAAEIGGIAWRRPASSSTALEVGDGPAGALVPRDDGGLDLKVAAASPTDPPALAVSLLGGTGDVEFGSDLEVQGELTARSNLTVTGAVQVNGDTHLGSTLSVDGPLTAGTALSVGGALHAAQATVQELAVTGNATIGAGGRLTTRHVDGKRDADGTADDLFLNSDTGKAVHVGGATPATLAVHGSAAVDANLAVTGDAVVQASLDVHHDVTVVGRASVGLLAVHGDATVGAGGNGTLTARHVNGKNYTDDSADALFLNWNTGKDVHVGGGAMAGLAVHGPATLDGELRPNGGIRVPNGATLTADGRLHISGSELLYLLNQAGVIVSKAWGGSGDLVVEGRIGVNGWPAQPRTPGWGGGIRTWDIEVEGTGWSRSGWKSGPRDLAENFEAADDVEAGDVVCFRRTDNRVIASSNPMDPLVCGIVSGDPGLLLGVNPDSDESMVAVALCGRVKCKVTDENGAIRTGDLLTTSSTRGHAMRFARDGGAPGPAGTIIGKALAAFSGRIGIIEVLAFAR